MHKMPKRLSQNFSRDAKGLKIFYLLLKARIIVKKSVRQENLIFFRKG